MDTLRINCQGAALMPLDKLVALQGDLKELSVQSYEKFKSILLRDGFAFPVAVARIKGRPYGVIDGHQRHRVLSKLVEEGGQIVGADGKPTHSIPVVWTDCRDKKHAARLILAAVSQFGHLTDDGLYAFANENGIAIPSLAEFDFTGFDTDRFIKGFGPDGGVPPDDPPDADPALADTQATIGEYRWEIGRGAYVAWIEKIRLKVGFEEDKIVRELRKRLGV